MTPAPKSAEGLLELCPDAVKGKLAGQVDRAMGLLQPILSSVEATADIGEHARTTLLLAVETGCALKEVLGSKSRKLSVWQGELLLQQFLLLFASGASWNSFTDLALDRIEESNSVLGLLPQPTNDPFDDFVRTGALIDNARDGDAIVAALIAAWRDGSRCAGRLFGILAEAVAVGNDLISV